MKKSPFVVVDHRSTHHAIHSGYSTLVRYLPATVVPEVPRRFPPWRVQKLMSRVGTPIYTTQSVTKELEALYLMLKQRRGLLHFLNGENDFFYSGYWTRPLGWRTTATFHYPPDRLRELIGSGKFLRKLDGLVCVGSNQVNYLKEVAGHERVWFCPHGVDLEYFTPGSEPWSPQQCLFVGQHLRDFELLGKTLVALRDRFPRLQVTAILRKDAQHLLPDLPWLTCRSGISDEELRSCYRTSSFLLLPLKDSTANCTVLEAIACGLPVVTNDVGSIRDYVNEGSAFVCKSLEEMVEASSALINDLDLNTRMRRQARQQALQFGWERIAANLMSKFQQHFELHLPGDWG